MKKKFSRPIDFLFLAFCLLFAPQVEAQLSFSNKSDLLPPGNYYSDYSVGVADMNSDGFDDIIRFSDFGLTLFIEYQKPDGTGFETLELGTIGTESQLTMSIADIDNNGFNDVITGGLEDGIKIITSDDQGIPFINGQLPGDPFFAQGSNLVDINNDGWLDAFVCDDEAESNIWSNDGVGNLLIANDWIDMATVPSSDNSGNYGSVWTDFDNDGDLDLYIAKCREGVNSQNDPRRINALFLNDGNNNYTESALEYGLKIGDQSWTAEFQDIDNDGDLDCLVANHYSNSKLLENDGTGHFTDISVDAGIGNLDFPNQCLMRDFDNDGFVDIIVAGRFSSSSYYHNNGDHTFSLETEKLFGSKTLYSFGIGDLNRDGFLDVYSIYKGIANSDSLWINDRNDNNFIAIDLTGMISNRNGIGARIEIYGPWGIQIREVRAGESYGIHTTFTQHFGLGENADVDSIIVKWPSGIIDKIESIPGNQFLRIEENGCVSPNSNLNLSGEMVLCEGDSLTLSAPPGFDYQWSNGSNTPSIVVTESGSYKVTVSDGGDCSGISPTVTISPGAIIIPRISITGRPVFCPGTSTTLTASLSTNYEWSTGDTTQTIEVFEAGEYWVKSPGDCEIFQSELIAVDLFDIPNPETFNDTVVKMGAGWLRAEGENLAWYDQITGGMHLTDGPSFMTPVLEETTTYWVEDSILVLGKTQYGGKVDRSELGGFVDDNFLGMSAKFTEPVVLKSVKVYSNMAGKRTIRFRNKETGIYIGSRERDIPIGESRVILDMDLPKSKEVYIFMDSNVHLYHDEDLSKINFPYPLGNFGEILETDDGFYYYFYDWEIETADQLTCVSERSPAVLFVDDDVATKNPSNVLAVKAFPNPAKASFNVQVDLLEPASMQVVDLQGKILLQDHLKSGNKINKEIETADWARGVYFVKITSGSAVYFGKIVLQ